MKVLYVYNEMPDTYQHYLSSLYIKLKSELNIRTLTYKENKNADYQSLPPFWYRYYLFLLFKLNISKTPNYDFLRMQQFDIVHIQHSFLWNRLIPLFNLKKRPKVIFTLRGGDTYVKPWTFRRMAEFYKNKSSDVAAFVVMSGHHKLYLEFWGVPSNKIHIIPISFGESSEANAKYPNSACLKLVSAFRMTWEKNITGHIEFARLLKAKGIPFEYDIYGDGDDLNQLFFLVHKHQLEREVHIKGKISNDDLQKVFPTYDFCLQLSLSESLGMAVIQAQSHGLPCIVSDNGGLPEVVINEQTGCVGSLDHITALVDKSISLWKEPERYHRYSGQAINHVNSHYTMSQEIANLKRLYEKVLTT